MNTLANNPEMGQIGKPNMQNKIRFIKVGYTYKYTSSTISNNSRDNKYNHNSNNSHNNNNDNNNNSNSNNNRATTNTITTTTHSTLSTNTAKFQINIHTYNISFDHRNHNQILRNNI